MKDRMAQEEHAPRAVDPATLERLLGLGDSTLRRDLCTQLSADIRRLREAVAGTEVGDVLRAAHELKGLAATIGAIRLAEMALALETAAAGSHPPHAAGLIPGLQAEADAVLTQLRDASAGGPSA